MLIVLFKNSSHSYPAPIHSPLPTTGVILLLLLLLLWKREWREQAELFHNFQSSYLPIVFISRYTDRVITITSSQASKPCSLRSHSFLSSFLAPPHLVHRLHQAQRSCQDDLDESVGVSPFAAQREAEGGESSRHKGVDADPATASLSRSNRFQWSVGRVD
jgi:hypothetical protein